MKAWVSTSGARMAAGNRDTGSNTGKLGLQAGQIVVLDSGMPELQPSPYSDTS